STNVLYVAQGNASHWLSSRTLGASGLRWIDETAPAASFRCAAMTRYRQPGQPCRVDVDGDTCRVHFDDAQRAVTPGQSVVFYDGDVCLGGAVIDWSDAPFGGPDVTALGHAHA
ncbi:MAG: aminomethyltransferase beta-barrel domain-containing protein, partial [Dokdonella sp.]|uniref:aminomethyltransferase beta-barrel domain-containing protein n=1 Tax=Dokdonella sp. TaxID=2291710 RepID=UPI003266B5EB